MSVAVELMDPYLFERVELAEDEGATENRVMGVLPCCSCGGCRMCYA